MVILKMENFLKNQMVLSNHDVNNLAKISEKEMEELRSNEDALNSSLSHIDQDLTHMSSPTRSESSNGNQQQFDMLALEEYKKQLEKDSVNIEYLRNVITKYLEYLAVGNTKEITTLETVIFTVLKV